MTKVLLFALGLCVAIIIYLLYLNRYYEKMLTKTVNLCEQSVIKLDEFAKANKELMNVNQGLMLRLQEYEGG